MCSPEETVPCMMYANRYQQIKKLGQGSFGTAFLVQDTKSKQEKKVLKAIYIEEVSPNESLDAEHEASILARLRHPNIVRFYDSFVDVNYFCIVTEYCQDGDLDQYLKSLRKQRSRLQMDQVIDLFLQLLSAIDFLHSKKILHRDIKTSNIFLKRNHIKLGDFGISRLMMNTLDKASTFIGTPFYMSPETLRYDGYNMKSDIWSLGCVLYELSVCKRAFERSNLVQTMEAILRDAPPSLPERFPARVQQLYLQMLSKDPEKRMAASELLEEFGQIEIKPGQKQKLTSQSSTPNLDIRKLTVAAYNQIYLADVLSYERTMTCLKFIGIYSDPILKLHVDSVMKHHLSSIESTHPDFRRSFSNSPVVNKHIRSSLQVPASPVHSASSMDSIDSSETSITALDDVQGLDDNCDPFSPSAKEIKTDFCRNKAQALVGSEDFNRIYDYLHDQREKQAEDATRTDDVLLAGLETLCSNSYARQLINELVLLDCVNELCERTQTS